MAQVVVTRRATARALAILLVFVVGAFSVAHAATKRIDLDEDPANGNESQCDLNVLSTFPIKIENVVTNKAVGDAFNFNWFSAGPGGFTSSAAAGTEGGVGAKWTWTTNESVYSFTGTNCEQDICFLQTAGSGPIDSNCSLGCLDDGVALSVDKGPLAGEVDLFWTGGDPTYTIYRSSDASAVPAPENELATTDQLQYTDATSGSGTVYYIVRAATCLQQKPCSSDADCNPATEGTCFNRGPFAVPGRSLTPTDITVSSASLTSSLIEFFSPPRELFRVTERVVPGGKLEIIVNNTGVDQQVESDEIPLGCCPEDPLVPQQLRCGDDCVDYLNDPLNCGACDNACAEDECCTNGNCVSLCPEGQILCPSGECVDPLNDSGNCGACGNVCEDGTCCFEGVCAGVCETGDTYCGDDQCADLQNDDLNCGECGTPCVGDSCCFEGACAQFCDEGDTWCGDGDCADLQNDNLNCGACDSICPDGTCCSSGGCVSICETGDSYCGDGQCADLQNDNQNCGTCGNICPDGTCCSSGVCESICDAGDSYCGDGQCADLVNDNGNCGTCGNSCPEGTCCFEGSCAAFVCEEGRDLCSDGLCYDLMNDPNNCGACGNECGGQAFCDAGVCVPCDGQGGRKDQCDNRCVNLNTDPYNCGACGNSCQDQCPSDFTGVCSQGQSCRCEEGVPPPPPPPNTPVPTEPFCPNANPSPGPVPGVCDNPNNTSGSVPGVCPNPANTAGPVPGGCPNPEPSPGPVPGSCPNPFPSSPIPPSCPSPGPPPPDVDEAPVCDAERIEETVLPGETLTICRPGPLLYKEVASDVTVCGDTIPGPNQDCPTGGTTNVTTGPFMRFIPDRETEVGDAHATPFAVHVNSDDSGDRLIGPGETIAMSIEVLNVGPFPILETQATLIAEPADLTDNGINDPVQLTMLSDTSSYGTIEGTQPAVDCEVVLQPAINELEFQFVVPADHPGDTAHPVKLRFTGTVNGAAFEQDMPINLGVVDRCVYEEATRDFDGIDGLLNPMARLVPEGDEVPFPTKTFNQGKTIPLKTRVLCGGVELKGAEIDPPEIVGLVEETLGPLDIATLNLNADADDLFFRFNETTKQWILNLRTDDLGLGVYILEIRIGNRKSYFAGFELR